SEYTSISHKLINQIIKDLSNIHKLQNPNLILISSSIPEIESATISRLGRIEVRELDDKSMLRALKYHLSLNTIDLDSQKIELLVKKLKGYPLSLNLINSLVVERGIDAVLEDISVSRRLFVDLAHSLLNHINFSS